MGMGSFLAVSRASDLGARLIHLTYSPGAESGRGLVEVWAVAWIVNKCLAGGDVKKKVGIIGKGLTFDSGGYNLKGSGPGSAPKSEKFQMT